MVELAYFPSSMTVVANDLSSLEYAKAFAGLGTKVTLVVENKASFDKACADAKVGADSAAAIVKSLEGMGVSVSYDDSVSSADSSSDPSGSPFEVKFVLGKTLQTNALPLGQEVLGKHGLNPNTSISTCRDEICRPFTEKLDSVWGQSFNIASLGGFVFCGKTGFSAGMAHAPVDADGKERYVFWVAPHIAYGIQHIAGKVFRPGHEGPSSACGTLIALQGEIANAKLAVGLDPDDTEMSLLRQQVLGKLEYGQVPNLTGITYAAHDCVLEQVKNTGTAEAVINPEKCEYVVMSGIQIHGARNKNFFRPGTIRKYAGGVETDLTSDYRTANKHWKLDKWLQAEALNQVRANSKGGRLPAIFSEVEL